MNNKNMVLAVLFAVGDKIEESEITRITRLNLEDVQSCLKELKQQYRESDSPFVILDESPKWKFTVQEEYMEVVQQIVPHTELDKPLMETLAVIAWKAPVLQSDIIQIRSTKAYEHIQELEEMGFVVKKRHGRSFMLRLAQRFYEYFDLKGKEDIEKRFEGYRDITEADVILRSLEEEGVEPYGVGEAEKEEILKEIQELDEEKLGKLEVFDEQEEDAAKPEIVDIEKNGQPSKQTEQSEKGSAGKNDPGDSNKLDELSKKLTEKIEELEDDAST
ncbi:SMC-Scp complex subunit ScpB [Candidatus Woesearchaeota archaeon]|nr:SMC-Scp complex subunit ScpB [Candidatus Woesearchaeota archaeon]